MTEQVKVIAYGAYDRHNYGDLLFAIVLKRYLEANGRFSVLIAATKTSDLSQYGALPTIPLKQALDETSDQPKTMLIVAGGECLTAQWESIIGYLAPQSIYYPIKATPYLIGHKAFIYLSRMLTSIPSDVPLVLGERDLPGYKVMYNSVGGNQISSKEPLIHDAIEQNLKDCTYVSVRDRETSAELEKIDVEHNLVPDSAILISDIFPQRVDPAERGHIVFHISDHHAKRRIETIAQQLTELNVNTGLKIALLTIGKAPGHSDDEPLDKLQSLLGDERAYRVDSGHIEDIISCIASSKLYCGTSLHGAITALAYAVPQIALLPQNVIKLSSFLETWVPKQVCGFAEVRQISEIGTNLVNSFGDAQRAELRAVVEAMKGQVRANLDHMVALYDEAPANDETAAANSSDPDRIAVN
ncbi:polysaccharide pyruvyl transferase family protein [Stutzerimonas zhaodongensis]|uniref:Polysaccharide pyruvyl transferase family protein n=1 Tax=Stutzerimonas zhaodongensis TaxID=1176257 RepID=A0A3M2HR85_9GAMM|nr:polysaccharide pyruvyl transferase family protein [Stutzerimonas zhaodongensis]MCQ2028690.1 polysaccharide pyruvyl transferase family protein [Stutzerimonas zhaodongensis]MCQ4315331.1 polysaccharide pyruvyl transferase family protein [Stutzerimonas zhaodongensis]RMH90110.1 polysaccharide pyruvyl transferase family protein [Stutzerimonas zhaodongensis]